MIFAHFALFFLLAYYQLCGQVKPTKGGAQTFCQPDIWSNYALWKEAKLGVFKSSNLVSMCKLTKHQVDKMAYHKRMRRDRIADTLMKFSLGKVG